MTDGGAARRAREAPVRDERHARTEAHSGQRRGRGQHFAHARAALRPLVADDDHVARFDLAALDRRNGVLLAVEAARRADVMHHFRRDGALLHDRAFRREVAPEDGDAAVFAVRIVDAANHCAVDVRRFLDAVAHRTADRRDIEADQVFARKFLHHGRDSADLAEIGDEDFARRVQLADLRRRAADSVNIVNVERHAHLMGDRRKMQHRVGRAAEGHLAAQRVAERLFREDVAGPAVLLQQLHDLFARQFGKTDARRINGRDRAVAGQCHADGFGQAIHRVGGVHAGAASAARTGGLLHFAQLSVGHLSGGMAADSFRYFGKADALAFELARQHGASADKDTGQIHAAGRHQHARHDLVAVRDKHRRVQRMRGQHDFDGVRDQFAGAERILHALVVHGDAVADADGLELERHAARVADAGFDRLADLTQMLVARDVIARRAHDRDERPPDFAVRQSERAQQGALRRTVGAFFDLIASHDETLLLL